VKLVVNPFEKPNPKEPATEFKKPALPSKAPPFLPKPQKGWATPNRFRGARKNVHGPSAGLVASLLPITDSV
jgi:hypothetical protein